jgi:hypothetical protein
MRMLDTRELIYLLALGERKSEQWDQLGLVIVAAIFHFICGER